MYFRLTRGRFDPARYDAVMPLVPAVTAALRGLPGVQDVRVGIDRSSGRTLSLTSFETLEDAQFSRDRLRSVLQPLQELGWEPEAPEIYEATDLAVAAARLPAPPEHATIVETGSENSFQRCSGVTRD